MSKPEFVYMAVIAAPPEKVWQCMTSAEFTRQYWHSTEVRSDFKKGSPIEFLTPDGEVGVRGEILEAEFPSRLSYSWRFLRDPGTQDDPPSRVTFSLEPLNVGTRLTVVHDRLAEGSKTAELVTFGWPHVIGGMKTLLETGSAVDFSAAEAVDCPGQRAANA
ncbi:MAG: SRPBCC family protein [Woeseiaceae bacterium]|nr:SRPBCC family protein [Woeseiaceae bacterium]